MNKRNLRNPIKETCKESLKKQFLKLQNECYLCGKELNTYVEYLPQTHFVVEKAQCHSCMTMVRVKNHSIH